MSAANLVGMKFGRLSVICRFGSDHSRSAVWKCRCDCGKDVFVTAHNLKTGNTKSCGCLNRELAAQRKTKHGGCGTRPEHNLETAEERLAQQAENVKDRVPVVHCKNCKHKGWVQEPCHGKSIDYCRVWDCTLRDLETNFCSYGERKNTDENESR